MKTGISAIVLTLLVLFAHTASFGADRCCVGMRGNIDYSVGDDPDIADLVYLVDWMFSGGPMPPCTAEADLTGDNVIDIADLVYLVDFMFNGGPAPGECPPDVVPPVILPLAVGNQWYTFVTEFNESGQVTDEYVAIGWVEGDSIIDDSTWYIMTSDAVSASLWTNKDDGAWTWTDSVGQPQVLMMKYPATPGESYPVYSITVTVEDTLAEITVPAGTFYCHYYRAHIPIFGTVGKVWAAPYVGVVRAEEYGLTLFGTYLTKEVELLDYWVAKR
jgi:hypothetical protein